MRQIRPASRVASTSTVPHVMSYIIHSHTQRTKWQAMQSHILLFLKLVQIGCWWWCNGTSHYAGTWALSAKYLIFHQQLQEQQEQQQFRCQMLDYQIFMAFGRNIPGTLEHAGADEMKLYTIQQPAFGTHILPPLRLPNNWLLNVHTSSNCTHIIPCIPAITNMRIAHTHGLDSISGHTLISSAMNGQFAFRTESLIECPLSLVHSRRLLFHLFFIQLNGHLRFRNRSLRQN